MTHPVAESFFATYKKELIHTRPWSGLTEQTVDGMSLVKIERIIDALSHERHRFSR